jgi:hypothetical protein
MTEGSNVHPVDRMADIKAQIDELSREYDALRGKIVSGETSPVGDEWEAKVSAVSRRSILVADAERLLPAEMFDAVVKQRPQINVTLRRKQEHAAKPKRRSFKLRSRKREAA